MVKKLGNENDIIIYITNLDLVMGSMLFLFMQSLKDGKIYIKEIKNNIYTKGEYGDIHRALIAVKTLTNSLKTNIYTLV